MKIDDIERHALHLGRHPPGALQRPEPGRTGTSELALVTVRDRRGVEGHGFLGASFRSAKLDVEGLVTILRPAVIGEDALDREKIWQREWAARARSPTARIGAIDVALWDLAGKLAGLPVSALLGGYRGSVPAYVSSGHAADARGLCRAGAVLQGARLDTPTRSTRRAQAARTSTSAGRAQGGRRRL